MHTSDKMIYPCGLALVKRRRFYFSIAITTTAYFHHIRGIFTYTSHCQRTTSISKYPVFCALQDRSQLRHEPFFHTATRTRPIARMNRGNIPGFYYDEEKKKYFKITANHAAPVNARYSMANVKREQREKRDLKKRKKEEQLVRTQTVHRAAVLQNPLLSTALKREIGLCTAQNLRSSRDDAIVGSLEYGRIHPRVEDFQTWPLVVDAAVHQDRMLLATGTSNQEGAACVASYEWDDSISGVHHLKEQRPFVALPGAFVSMQHVSSMLFVVTEYKDAMYFYLGPSDPLDVSPGVLHPKLKSTVKAHACAYEPYTHNIAFAGLGLRAANGMSPGKTSNRRWEKYDPPQAKANAL